MITPRILLNSVDHIGLVGPEHQPALSNQWPTENLKLLQQLGATTTSVYSQFAKKTIIDGG
ncbi:MAG: hypothetical protein VX669_09125, partial [Planctomycetota bacterium]|nr:hypothetical protein [Planctomycetota bacterium]